MAIPGAKYLFEGQSWEDVEPEFVTLCEDLVLKQMGDDYDVETLCAPIIGMYGSIVSVSTLNIGSNDCLLTYLLPWNTFEYVFHTPGLQISLLTIFLTQGVRNMFKSINTSFKLTLFLWQNLNDAQHRALLCVA